MHQGWDLGVPGGGGGVKNFSVGICDGAPLTARSSFNCFFDDFNCVFTQIRCLSVLLIYRSDKKTKQK